MAKTLSHQWKPLCVGDNLSPYCENIFQGENISTITKMSASAETFLHGEYFTIYHQKIRMHRKMSAQRVIICSFYIIYVQK